MFNVIALTATKEPNIAATCASVHCISGLYVSLAIGYAMTVKKNPHKIVNRTA